MNCDVRRSILSQLPLPTPISELLFCLRHSHLSLVLGIGSDEVSKLSDDLGIAVGIAAVLEAVGLGADQREDLALNCPGTLDPASLGTATAKFDGRSDQDRIVQPISISIFITLKGPTTILDEMGQASG